MATAPLSELIRARLGAAPRSVIGGDHVVAGVPAPESESLRPAAVLVPLVARREQYTVLLTRRAEHLAHHPGQVSFPGGRSEPQDGGPVGTALREAAEEIGLAARHVEVVGFLDLYQTVSGFLVTPVVAVVKPEFTVNPDPFEVADVFEVPLVHALDPANHERHSRVFNGQQREFYVVPWRDYYIWGATAAMLVDLSRRLGPGLFRRPRARR